MRTKKSEKKRTESRKNGKIVGQSPAKMGRPPVLVDAKKVLIWIDRPLIQAIRERATAEGVTASEWMRRALGQAIGGGNGR